MKHIHFLTIFPSMFRELTTTSITGRAAEKGLVQYHVHDLRQWGLGKRQDIDDKPYGGGPGMVMMVEPIYKAITEICQPREDFSIIITSAKGKLFTQKKAEQLQGSKNHLLFICGHYEGIDERVTEKLANEELSIGQYVLSGGELAAAVMADAVVRLVPGVLGNELSAELESFSDHYELERGQYTRPEVFTTNSGDEWRVPGILLSGNHEKIDQWRRGE